MLQPFQPDIAYLTGLPDGTVKQINPFTGTEVWTVPGRGHRPLNVVKEAPRPLTGENHGRYCAFCEHRYWESPPEKARVVRRDGQWITLDRLPAEKLNDSVAEFRLIPNLFEILSFDYWHANYGYELPTDVENRKTAYLASERGHRHVMDVAAQKLRASGRTREEIETMSEEDLLAFATGFFGGGHDVVTARRHYVDGATDSSQLASSGTLTPQEHYYYIAFTVEAARRLYATNRYARYVAVFQNWLKPAGASFDHLHKQAVAIDERGVNNELVIQRLRANPNLFNEAGVNYAGYHNLLLAENDHAIAYAGYGHRYPTIEIYSKSPRTHPWNQTEAEIGGMSDLIHAMHAAGGTDLPCNEEWQHQPIDVDVPMPWRVQLKWRVSTVAGFEGGTKIYLNTIDPYQLRDRVVPALFALRDRGTIAPIRIAMECSSRPNQLLYNQR